MYTAFGIIVALAVVVTAILLHPAFGALPRGERMERIRRSPNYRAGSFKNLEVTSTMVPGKSTAVLLREFLLARPKNLTPDHAVETVRTDLRALDLSKDQMVWLGHSSYLIATGGKTVLVDPVLTSSFPSNLVMTPFKGAAVYTPTDIPAIDFLVITHDHWDHLDYGTLRAIKDRVSHVVTPLGVGAHLERWGYGDRLTEMDWGDSVEIEGTKFTCLPTRHFSGRLFKRCQSLWGSFMMESSGKVIFMGGDGGYGKHFAKIAGQFPDIDLAIVENGQYGENWPYIHTLPSQLPTIIGTLNARKTIPVHNGKYALARHAWDEPTKKIRAAAEQDSSLRIEIPIIGKPIAIE